MMSSANRLLFNGDPHIFFRNGVIGSFQPEGGRFSVANIHGYVKLLAENRVDTLVMCANTQVAWHPSKVWPTILDHYTRGAIDHFRADGIAMYLSEAEQAKSRRGHAALLDLYLDLVEDGVDWLAEACQACREAGISPWVSVRMNDLHGHPHPQEDWRMRGSLFADPDMRLSGKCLYPKDGAYIRWSGLNYGLLPVREHMQALIGEFVRDYDIDGVELDWWREPRCCEYPASEQDIDAMTAWGLSLRQLTRQAKPECRLGIRGPQNLGLMRSIGLDLPALSAADVLDFYIPSNHWQTSWEVDYDALRKQLGSQVKVYGCIEDAPNWLHAAPADQRGSSLRYLSGSPELLRGNAANKWAAGVDGLEFFNFYCTDGAESFPGDGNYVPDVKPQYDCIPSLARLRDVRGRAKHYCLATLAGDALGSQPFDEVSPLPQVLLPQGKLVLRLTMCAEPVGEHLELFIQVIVDQAARIPEIGIGFNGAWPSFDAAWTQELLFPVGDGVLHTTNHVAFNFRHPVDRILEGWNTITVWNSGHVAGEPGDPSDVSLTIIGVECAIREPQGAPAP